MPRRRPRLWDLDDLVANGDITDELGLARAIVSNWARRHADFPGPLMVLSSGPVYSRRQVTAWLERHPSLGQPRRER